MHPSTEGVKVYFAQYWLKDGEWRGKGGKNWSEKRRKGNGRWWERIIGKMWERKKKDIGEIKRYNMESKIKRMWKEIKDKRELKDDRVEKIRN